MNDFFPIIIIEIVITFGGVLFLYWWSMRDIKLWRGKKTATARTKRQGRKKSIGFNF